MRIYAVADIHARIRKIRLILDTILKHKPDVLVIAGDITNIVNPVPILARLNQIPVPVLAIRGNTDLARVENLIGRYPNITSLHLKQITMNGVNFAGVSGTFPLPFHSRIALREGPIRQQLEPLVKKDTVLVAHPPPYGVLDEVMGRFHAGSRALYDIISKGQPRLMICGHIHERPGTALIGKTRVVNCAMARTGAGAMIELSKDEIRLEML